jgi:hypothetical protein
MAAFSDSQGPIVAAQYELVHIGSEGCVVVVLQSAQKAYSRQWISAREVKPIRKV